MIYSLIHAVYGSFVRINNHMKVLSKNRLLANYVIFRIFRSFNMTPFSFVL